MITAESRWQRPWGCQSHCIQVQEAERWFAALAVFNILMGSRSQSQEMMLLTFRVNLLSSVSLIKVISLGHGQQLPQSRWPHTVVSRGLCPLWLCPRSCQPGKHCYPSQVGRSDSPVLEFGFVSHSLLSSWQHYHIRASQVCLYNLSWSHTLISRMGGGTH